MRETVGKIVSAITLMIGYIMAAFTERKQALHDKIASTAVVYKDPNKKVAVWIIIIMLILPIIAIVGILASITLVSLNSARNTTRNRANEASIGVTLNSIMMTAGVYFDNNDSFNGFNPSIKLPNCSGKAIINISSDGQEMAIFAKSCSDSKKYFCIDAKSGGAGIVNKVDEILVDNKRTSCSAR